MRTAANAALLHLTFSSLRIASHSAVAWLRPGKRHAALSSRLRAYQYAAERRSLLYLPSPCCNMLPSVPRIKSTCCWTRAHAGLQDVRLNASAWTTDTAEDDPAEGGGKAAEGGGEGGGGEEDGDELWDSFRNVAEREKEQVRTAFGVGVWSAVVGSLWAGGG